jgi:phosphatidylinositol alpha-1,6-mannosyltransferase
MAAMLRQHADLFIMPNVERVGDVEGYGIAPLESMYVGTPVVAFDVDALGESIRSGGYLVDAGDYPAFAARVAEHLNLSSAQKTQMATAARDYVLREYNWELTARRYRALFDGRALDAYNEPEA